MHGMSRCSTADRFSSVAPAEVNDTQLLQCLLAGEQKAYRELTIKLQGAMRAVAFAIVGQRYVDDVVQEAWLAVVRNLRGFQGRSSLKTWILTITANAAKCRYVQNRREVLMDDLPGSHGHVDDGRFSSSDGHWLVSPHAWHEETPEALLCEEEFRNLLEDTLQGLTEQQSTVLLLRERQGLELEAIAEKLGISLTNVRVILHRARLKLFAAIEQYESTGVN